ncbi:MAG TPA: PAS domain S-box protein [Telluria sp.]|jgi:PAS domain S-box-containing protein
MDFTYFTRSRRALQLLLAILLAGGAVTAGVVMEIARSNERMVRVQARDAAAAALAQVDMMLQRYRHGLAGVRGAIALSGPAGMDRAAFERYSQARDDRLVFPGALGFGFIRRVEPGATGAYIARQRSSSWPDFRLRQIAPHAGERAIIELIEPVGTNQAVIGLDIASEPVRRAGMAAATASGMATLTAPLKLVQAGGSGAPSFLMLLPVYEAGAYPAPAARPVAGWAFAPLVVKDVLAHLPHQLPDGAFTLADSAPGRPPAPFFAAGAGAPGLAGATLSRRVMGREWIATFQPSGAFVAQLRLPRPLHAGLAGAGLTLLCAALAAALSAERARLRRLHATEEQRLIQRTAELDSARRDLRTIFDAVPSMIAYFDSRQYNRFANRAYGDWFGAAPAALAGQSMQDVLGAALYQRNERYIDGVLRGEPQAFERVAAGHDGVVRHYLAKYLPDISAGKVQGFYVVIHDVTEVVESRQALASALRVNDVLVRTINEQILYSVTDTAGIILEVNDNFCAAYGYLREELIGIHYRHLASDQHDPRFWAGMREAVMAGRSWNGTVCNRMVDGTAKWFDTVVAPYFNEHGVIERYVALHTDVTARRAADAALRHVSALLGNVLQAATEMSMIATDTEGLITVFNAGAERMLGYRAAEMIGKMPTLLHDSVELAGHAAALSDQLGEPVQGLRTVLQMAERDGHDAREWTYVRKDGSRFPVLLTVTAIHDDTGAVLGFLGIGVDISQRKRDDAILHESIHRAEQASLAKSQFVANMSHEIRTPMNAMLGMLELMLRTDLSARQRDYVDKAGSAGAALMGLLNDVLDFSKIDAGKLELDQHVFAVDGLLRGLGTVLTGNGVHKQVEVVFDIAPAIPARLFGDGQRIGQVLINLAGNALKFTHAGSVVVAMAVLDEGPGAMTVRFSVTDTGIGIPASQLDMIFDGFTQAEASTARRFGGTGLGLAISARIVELMGGTLAVSSEVGRGSRFWFDIMLGTAPDDAVLPPAVAAPRVERPRRLAGVRLLVVEDNALNRQVAFELLDAEGARVDLAEGGQQGVDMATVPAQAYDAVIMDVQMPDVDGLAATRQIRAVSRLAQLPIMAMTANVSPADRDACLAAGMDSHIGKPFDIDEVVARLRGLIDRNAVPLVDLAGALPRFFDDPGLYERMLAKFEQESGQLLARLAGEQLQENVRAEAATLHAMKGMALTMGLPRLAHVLAAPAGARSGHAALRMLTAVSIGAARSALPDWVD